MNKLIVLSFLLINIQVTNCQSNHFNILCGDSVKYWEPHYLFTDQISGVGFEFSNDSVFQEYCYYKEQKSPCNYNDILWDTFKYQITGDTLKILNYLDYNFIISKINFDTIVLEDISKIRYTYLDSILLVRTETPSVLQTPPVWKAASFEATNNSRMENPNNPKKSRKRFFIFLKRRE